MKIEKEEWDAMKLKVRQALTRHKAVDGRATKNRNSIVGLFRQNELNRQQLLDMMLDFLEKLAVPMQELYDEMVVESIRRDSFIQALMEILVPDEQDRERLKKRFEILFTQKIDRLDETKKGSATSERVLRLKKFMREAEDILGIKRRHTEDDGEEEPESDKPKQEGS